MAVALLVVGVLAGSTSVIFNKISTVHPMLLASYRQLIAAALLAPLGLRDCRAAGIAPTRALRRAALPGLILAAHFGTWIAGSRETLAANAALIVNLVPVLMPLLLFFAVGERVTWREGAGSLVALAGVGVLAFSDLRMGSETLRGDLLCFVSMVAYAVYLVLAKRNRGAGGLWAYVVPVYAVGGTASLLAALLWTDPLGPYAARDILAIFGLALVPTVVGHSVLNASMRRLRGQVVSVVAMSEFVFSGLLAYGLLAETPSWLFYPAAVLVVSGGILTVLAGASIASAGGRPSPLAGGEL